MSTTEHTFTSSTGQVHTIKRTKAPEFGLIVRLLDASKGLTHGRTVPEELGTETLLTCGAMSSCEAMQRTYNTKCPQYATEIVARNA